MDRISRRDVLASAAAVVGVAGAAALAGCGSSAKRGVSESPGDKPNILVVLVDEMRAPQWFPAQSDLDALLPNIGKLRKAGVSFEEHCTAATLCTPSRGALVTGLYPHQTGCLFTDGGKVPDGTVRGESSLSPKFPTWGSMLREQGYGTWWFGKWHLGDSGDTSQEGLAAYGFAGGTFPSPNGNPFDGQRRDPQIAEQFLGWFDQQAGKGPWCTTVSFVDPHDIVFWPGVPLLGDPPNRFAAPAPNLETLDELAANGKPRLQLDYARQMCEQKGIALPARDPAATQVYTRFLDAYLWLQQQVDGQIGRVLDKLASNPDVDRRTIVVFTSDHGEYAGSHGMGGKGASMYEETMRVPLYVRDPSGRLTPKPGDIRRQLTSSVDLAPLLLTIAAGGPGWRADPRYSHLKDRADIAAIAHDPRAQGRPWQAFTTDDISIEEVNGQVRTEAANHIVAVRAPQAKYAVYSYWKPGVIEIDASRPQEHEFYDRSTDQGRAETLNQAGKGNPLETQLAGLWQQQVLAEVNAPVPPALKAAQQQGYANMAEHVDKRDKQPERVLRTGG